MIRIINWFLFSAIIFAVAFMFDVKSSVQDLNFEIRQITSQIEQEKIQYNLLKAELAYLNSPKRILTLARQYLDLEPINPNQIILINSSENNVENLIHNIKNNGSTKWRYKKTGLSHIRSTSTQIKVGAR